MAKQNIKLPHRNLWLYTRWIMVAIFIFFPIGIRAAEDVSEIRDVGKFHSVEFKGRGDVYLTQGGDVELRLEGDEKLLEEYETVVKNGILIIKNDSWMKLWRSKSVTVYITIPEIRKLSVAGSGSIIGESTITSDSLMLQLAGSGEIELDIQAKKLGSNISGSGEMRLRGMVNNLRHTIAGSGDLKGFDLETGTSEIKISGSGKCELFVSDRLDVLISGSGNVFYRGEPKMVNQEVSGSGKVKKVE